MTLPKKLAHPGHVIPKAALLVRLRDLTREHRGRLVEIRYEDGEGVVGSLVDAAFYLFDEIVAIRFAGEQKGIFAAPDDVVVVHGADSTAEEIAAFYGGEAGP